MTITKVKNDGVDFSEASNIAFDTNTLYVDAINNRVGIGMTSPSYKLDTYGAVASRGSGLGNASFVLQEQGNNPWHLLQFTGGAFSINYNGTSSVNSTLAIDSSGNVGIGATSPDTRLTVYDAIKIYQSALTDSLTLSVNTGSSYAVTGTVDDVGLSFDNNTSIRGYRFSTNGSEKVRIDSEGLKFNGDTAAANALDDYEQGDFSPTWQQGITSPTLGAAEGYYTKVGNLVTFSMLIYANSGTANSSHMYIGGLPYTTSSVITPSGVTLNYQNGFKTNLDLSFHIPRSNTIIHLYTQSTGNPFYGVDATNVLKYLYLNGFYYTD